MTPRDGFPIVVLLLGACHAGPVPSGAAGVSFADTLADLDHGIVATQARAGADWTVHAQLGALHAGRARLTGSYDDYDRAEHDLVEAFALAPEGSGPHLQRAGLSLSLHRMDVVITDVDAAADRVLVDDAHAAAIALVRATHAWNTGDYDAGLAGFEASVALHPTTGAWASLAQHHWKTGDLSTAEAALDEAAALYHGTSPEPVAWLHLQRGLIDLEHGRLDQALAHYHDADDAMPGYWLVREHIAEVHARRGELILAEPLYRGVVASTGNPELMDALGDVLAVRGEHIEAEQWHDRAQSVYLAQLDRYPEATWGHALGHFLDHGHDPAFSVQMAQANAALRPTAEAHMLLARAWLQADRVPDAVDAIERALATPWFTAELYFTAAEVYAAAGDHGAAAEHRAMGLALDPTGP